MGRSNKIVPQSMCNWLLLLVFIMQFVVSLCARSVWGIFSSKPLNQYEYILIVEILAVAVPSVLLCIFNESGFVKTFGIKSVHFSKVWKCVCLGLCLQPVAVVANLLWQRLVGIAPSLSYVSAPWSIESFVMIFVFTCVVPALSEEFLLRGMYLSSVKRKGYTFSIVVSTLMFVLLHSDPSSVASHTILGASAAFAVLNTNSVFAGVFVHLSFNLGGMLADYTVGNFYTPGGFIGTFEFYLVLGGACLVLSSLLFKGIYAKKMKKTASSEFIPNLFKAVFNLPVLIIILIYIFRIVG